MGQGGEDIQLSPAARKKLPFNIECKNKNKVAVINWLLQADGHGEYYPLVVAKQNQSDPVVIIDAVTFFRMIKNGS
jgi:spore germination protein GerM